MISLWRRKSDAGARYIALSQFDGELHARAHAYVIISEREALRRQLAAEKEAGAERESGVATGEIVIGVDSYRRRESAQRPEPAIGARRH